MVMGFGGSWDEVGDFYSHPTVTKHRQLYLDCDGVLADFDRAYFEATGLRGSIVGEDVNWDLVDQIPHFYRDLPMMPDAEELLSFCWKYRPIIVTGLPFSIESAPEDKRIWITRNVSPSIPIVMCKSKEKYRVCQAGDVLVDDRDKYRHLWENEGGIWVAHVSAQKSIRKLKTLGYL